jgi:ABC-2 type transport system permease protein
MNAASSSMPDSSIERQVAAPAALRATRPMYWSVRRELWENRSIYVAPLAVAAVILLGFLVDAAHGRSRVSDLLPLDSASQRPLIELAYAVAPVLILLTAFLVAVFYCLDALHGERRDRSILFWKSLPVSDLTTVLSKASIPLVILPLVSFSVIVVTQSIMLLISTIALLAVGASPAALFGKLPLFQMSLALIYALAVIALWFAPIYGWLVLVSGSVRRAALLWAVLPPLAIGIFEHMAFHTSHFAHLMRYRFFGWFTQGFVLPGRGRLPSNLLAALDPGKFLATPGLWLGLAVAAGFFAAAVRLRRYRGPL